MNAVVNVNGVTHIIVFENYSTTPAPLEGQLGLVLNESVSTTNLSAIEVVPVAAAGAVFGILLVIGVIATSIFIAVLIAGRAKFAEFPFFVLVWHMTVANAIHMVMVISTIMPIMLIEIGDDGPQRMWYIWGSRILSLTEQAVLYFTLLMTINRFAVFVFPQLLIAFTHTRVMILSILAWMYIVFIVAWNVYSGSSKTFSKKKLSMQETILGNNFLSTIFTLSSTVLPIVMLAMYGIIFIFIIKKRGACADAATSEKDRSLLWQALAVAVCLELTKFTNMITPLLSGATSWVQWVWTIFSYSTSILNQMINPLLFLTMNKMVRGVLKSFFRSGSSGISSDLGENPKHSNSAQPGCCQKICRLFIRQKQMLTNNRPTSRGTWVF